jgi:[NiFe] hydrogenase diaphorase moiety small subunit
MSQEITFTIDGVEIKAQAGQTIMEAADAAGVYIPRLCYLKEVTPHGSCRVCTVMANGRPQAACTQPVAPNMVVENDTDELNEHRRNIIDMMFVEGNHFCMFCERSGNCELQAMAYRFGITAPQYPFQFPPKDVDASHPDVMLDHNRCIMCARCVRASQELDGKNVFQSIGRGFDRKIGVNGEKVLADTDMSVNDRAADVCPVGCIIKKRTAFETPVGERQFDHQPIGSDIEEATQ